VQQATLFPLALTLESMGTNLPSFVFFGSVKITVEDKWRNAVKIYCMTQIMN